MFIKDMLPNNIYFTSDHHFGHYNIIRICKRKESTLDEMHENLIHSWNSIVKKDDIIFHLGDFFFKCNQKKALEIRERLNGKIYWVKGNHDSIKISKAIDIEYHDYIEMNVSNNNEGHSRLVLCHFPIASWNKMHRGSYHIHGHCHGNFINKGKSIDVGVDNVGYTPISWNQIKQELDEKI